MRRPWNIVDQPVYSLATYVDGTFNMNICTYVTAVSMQPKMYAVAVYHNTKTLLHLQQSDIAVLQLLSKSQISLVRTLGKKSGHNYDKVSYLQRKKMITSWKGFSVLENAAALLLLHKKSVVSTGDHDVYIFEVQQLSTLQETDILTFSELIKQGVIL
jgi:flavin reductase (DIM6/NTAB) family NADH-FMN oxidoreductase RutF